MVFGHVFSMHLSPYCKVLYHHIIAYIRCDRRLCHAIGSYPTPQTSKFSSFLPNMVVVSPNYLDQVAISIPAAEKTETQRGRGFWLLAIPFAQRPPPIQCPGYKVHTHTAAGRTQPNIRTFGDP